MQQTTALTSLLMSQEQLNECLKKTYKLALDEFKDFLGERENQDELLTRKQTSELLSINLSTLNIWTKEGKLTAYGIGNRVYYKKNEIIEKSLIQLN